MSREEQNERIGPLVLDLSETIRKFRKAQSDAHKLTPDLRVIADCFDKSIDNMWVDQVFPEGFTVDRKNTKHSPLSGPREEKVPIPSGDEITGLIIRMDELSGKVKSLLEDIKNEGIDLCGICETALEICNRKSGNS